MANDELRQTTETLERTMGEIARVHTTFAINAEMMVGVLNERLHATDTADDFTDVGLMLMARQRDAIGPAVGAMRRHVEALEVMERLYGRLLTRRNG